MGDDCVNNPHGLQENLPINFGLNKQKKQGRTLWTQACCGIAGTRRDAHRTFSSSERTLPEISNVVALFQAQGTSKNGGRFESTDGDTSSGYYHKMMERKDKRECGWPFSGLLIQTLN